MCLSCLPPCGRAPAVADRFGRGVAMHVVGQDVECMLASARRRRPYRTVATRLTRGQLTLGLDSPEPSTGCQTVPALSRAPGLARTPAQ